MAVSQGKTTFQQQWGRRENKDNWQRINVTVVNTTPEAESEDDGTESPTPSDSLSAGGLPANPEDVAQTTDSLASELCPAIVSPATPQPTTPTSEPTISHRYPSQRSRKPPAMPSYKTDSSMLASFSKTNSTTSRSANATCEGSQTTTMPTNTSTRRGITSICFMPDKATP